MCRIYDKQWHNKQIMGAQCLIRAPMWWQNGADSNYDLENKLWLWLLNRNSAKIFIFDLNLACVGL